MKIRSITAGFNITMPSITKRMERVGKFLGLARSAFEDAGYEVQTTRVTSQPWIEYLVASSTRAVCDRVRILEDCCRMNHIDFCSIGTVHTPKNTGLLVDIIESTEIISCSATIALRKTGLDHRVIRAAAQAILKIAERTASGVGNFRFAAIANCPPDIPFFPASYHRGRACFMIALEASDLIVKAFSSANDFMNASKNLKVILEKEYGKVENIALRIEKQGRFLFRGLDLSPAPSILPDESIVLAFERMGEGTFGAPGTLAIAGLITDVLRNIKVRQCGFSGLMLPVMEDFGLAQRIGSLNLDSLLAYSAVCGTGLDCVPLPGDTPTSKICGMLLDIATLALRLNKPLAARLLPIPGQQAGSLTNIDSPYLINCTIPKIG
jgi:uncharacterized protein (UPF0210 family)